MMYSNNKFYYEFCSKSTYFQHTRSIRARLLSTILSELMELMMLKCCVLLRTHVSHKLNFANPCQIYGSEIYVLAYVFYSYEITVTLKFHSTYKLLFVPNSLFYFNMPFFICFHSVKIIKLVRFLIICSSLRL